MASINRGNARPKNFTHEGAPAKNISAEAELRRAVLSCLLWEDQFYESGVDIHTRIKNLCENVPVTKIAELAIEAREQFHLRHVPLVLLLALVRRGKGRHVSETIARVIQRADELTEIVALFWAQEGKRKMLPKQLRLGLAEALGKFDEYRLAKYNRDGAVKLRDVMFLVHPKPRDEAQAELFRRLAANELATPDTWEVALSSGADKRETFERLLRNTVTPDIALPPGESTLGFLALLRNLRGMLEAGVDESLIKKALELGKGSGRVLPHRYVAAARAAPRLEPAIDKALVKKISGMEPLPGRTIILVDISGSMDAKLSTKSDLSRLDAAAALAAIVPGDVRVFSFSDNVVEVPPRRGMAGIEAVTRSQMHGGTRLGSAVARVNKEAHDRLIVLTDEQSSDPVGRPVARHAYMINVASYKNGVGYGNGWVHIDGFSEATLRFIAEYERETTKS